MWYMPIKGILCTVGEKSTNRLMESKIINLEVKSAQKLEEALRAFKNTKRPDSVGLAFLNLFGPQILVRQFELPRLSRQEIKNALKLEATEIFSLLPDEIEIDYQILRSLKQRVQGIFVAIPKRLLLDYILRFDKAGVIPFAITASILSQINNFLHKHKPQRKNLCIIDFYKENIINLAVFHNNNCQLLREIYYDSLSDAEQEIIYSLKYAWGKSSQKKFEEVYCLGDLSGKDRLIDALQQGLSSEIKRYSPDKSQVNGRVINPYFNVDLFKSFTFSLSTRKRMLWAINIIIAACLGLLLLLSIGAVRNTLQIRRLSATYRADDYGYARDLQDALNILKNVQ